MGFFSAIGGFISGCVGAVASVCSSIGGAVASGISALVATIAPHLSTIVQIVSVIAQVIGIFSKEDDVEDLGAAMRQCAKKPEDFDSINAYIDYLRNEIKEGRVDLNKEKTQMESAVDNALGCGLVIKGIEEKYQLSTSGEFWVFAAKKVDEGKLNADDVNSMLKTASEKNIKVDDMVNYVEGKEVSVPKSEISSSIKESLASADSNLSEGEITKKFNELVRKD